jgi:integrase
MQDENKPLKIARRLAPVYKLNPKYRPNARRPEVLKVKADEGTGQFVPSLDAVFLAYLEDREGYWSFATYKSERARMNTSVIPLIKQFGVDAEALHGHLVAQNKLNAYSTKQVLIRASSFIDWALEHKLYLGASNPFKTLLSRESKYFGKAYISKKVKLTFDALKDALTALPATKERDFALEMLKTGVRIHEAFLLVHQADKTQVIGKGGKARKVFGWSYPHAKPPTRAAVARILKEIGVTPHQLRKAFITRLAQKTELTHAEICAIAGWSSFTTAQRYMQVREEDKIAAMIAEAL